MILYIIVCTVLTILHSEMQKCKLKNRLRKCETVERSTVKYNRVQRMSQSIIFDMLLLISFILSIHIRYQMAFMKARQGRKICVGKITIKTEENLAVEGYKMQCNVMQ